MSTEAYVYDAIRTPRGRGKAERRPARHQAHRPRRRPHPRDPAPLPRPGPGRRSTTSCSASSARSATRAPTSPGSPRSPPDCRTPWRASRRTASVPPAWRPSTWPPLKVRSGWEDLVLAGGVESMSRVPMASDGGAWFNDPMTNLRDRLRPAGHRRRPHRHHRGLLPPRRRRVRGAVPGAGGRRPGRRAASTGPSSR